MRRCADPRQDSLIITEEAVREASCFPRTCRLRQVVKSNARFASGSSALPVRLNHGVLANPLASRKFVHYENENNPSFEKSRNRQLTSQQQ